MDELIGFDRTPVATIVFFITIGISLMALFGRNNLMDMLILHPVSFFRKKQYYTIISSGLIHADLMHLLFNMLSFYFFAFMLEATLRFESGNPPLGSLQFFIIYFASMALADIPSLAKNRNNYGYRSLGASGAISAVIFSSILYYPEAKIGMFFFPMGIPAPIFAVLYLAYCHFAGRQARDNINHDAHMYGAISGVVLTVAMSPGVLQTFVDKVFG